MSSKVIITNSALETQNLGKEHARLLKGGGIVLLYGDLGSGKTTYTQGFAKELGISRNVPSPTFLIMRTYEITKGYGAKFYHLDLYRITSEKEIKEVGFIDVVNNRENIVVVEWADRLKSLVPKKRLELHFEHLEQSKRKVTIRRYD